MIKFKNFKIFNNFLNTLLIIQMKVSEFDQLSCALAWAVPPHDTW